MSKAITQVNYDELRRISKDLQNEGEVIAHLHAATQRQVEALHGSGWTGEAANAFFREQEEHLLPAVLRVAWALNESELVLNQVMQIIHQADEETAGYFKGFGTPPGGQSQPKWDWKTFVDGILGLPFDEIGKALGGIGKAFKWLPIVSVIFGIYQDREAGADWGRAIFSELAEAGIDIGATALFPPYIAYPLALGWLHLASAQSQFLGRASWEAETIFEVAKFFDPTLTEADQAVWFQNTAEWLDLREEAGEVVYEAGKYFIEHANEYIYTGPGSPFSVPLQPTPIAL